jgi:Rod binding domain-containing protein
MSELGIAQLLPQVTASGSTGGSTAHKPDSPAKIRDAAQQFEALLLGQIMQSMRESGKGWLGTGDDPSGDCATEYAEQAFATALAKQGGLGLADLIAAGLTRED